MITISILDLEFVTGGAGSCCSCCSQSGVSHADQLENGNGGIVPKLPELSHADQLRNGNGGIVPKLPDLTGGGNDASDQSSM